MRRSLGPHRLLPFPRARNLVVDACRYGRSKNVVHGLFEIDVTEARRRIRSRERRTGEALSFTAFLVHGLARAVAEEPTVQAYRDWRRRLWVFEEVDVGTIIEREVHDATIGSVHVVRGAERKSVTEIHAEIRAEKARRVEAHHHLLWWAYLYLPGFVRGALWRILGRFPGFVKRNAGTVSVTSFGMYARGAGWGIPLGSHTLGLAVGGMERKPVVVDGEVEIREVVSVTLSLDHDVVDGAPAARFVDRLKARLERADGLEEEPE